ncbi:MAG: bifunctional folylpolyglutamate synthase/dihydrofolate synthase [Acetobacteraceae bacterium]|nr:bifunctional folylpolyglutamate synthase/dihydrofolate synthase [Acetobacteraceae bacterium]MSP29125.1 bifunctional folylpolyglutamate synthase/dihydrofolate synthase [Acetobacteraceae bacterium]
MSKRIEGVVARLHDLHPRLIDLSLDRLHELLEKLDHPERRLPQVIHVAGTNGKGSTCAFLRAMAEASGLRTHVFISPHLVRFNERIRIAGALVTDSALADALEHVENINAGAPITVFEMITAVALHLFAETPSDLCILEVGLGGRFDATNVIASPAACAITSISMDHREFLGDNIAAIAYEKAGILKPNIPCTVGVQEKMARDVILSHAEKIGASVLLRDRDWSITPTSTGLRYTDNTGTFELPSPSLLGAYQLDNAGIAITALRAARDKIPMSAIATGLTQAEWPARLQCLTGKLKSLLPDHWELYLDGGHNPGAGIVLAEQLRAWSDRPLHLIVGMKQAKDSVEFLRPMLPYATTLWAIAEPGQHLALPVEAIIAASGNIARPGPTAQAALRAIPKDGPPARVLICGSLYLAGEILKQN